MVEQEILVSTPDGKLDTFVCHPDEEGPHPIVVIYMDAPGIRDELREMASRLASVGYVVALPNLYYRIGREGHYGYDFAKIRSDDAHQKRMHECRLSLTNATIVSDTESLLPALRAPIFKCSRTSFLIWSATILLYTRMKDIYFCYINPYTCYVIDKSYE